APALSILAAAALKLAAALSRSLAATSSRVRFIKVLMTFFVIRLCMRRFVPCRMRLAADGEFGIARDGSGRRSMPDASGRHGRRPADAGAGRVGGYHDPRGQIKRRRRSATSRYVYSTAATSL